MFPTQGSNPVSCISYIAGGFYHWAPPEEPGLLAPEAKKDGKDDWMTDRAKLHEELPGWAEAWGTTQLLKEIWEQRPGVRNG